MVLTGLWSFPYNALISIVSIPVVLLLILLRDLVTSLFRFRRVYQHSPIPLNPAFGVVVAVEDFNADADAPYNVNTTNSTEDEDTNGNSNVEIIDTGEWCTSRYDEIKYSTSDKNGIHFSHAFKSYRNDNNTHRKALNLAIKRVPIRILIIGDSIARGVGVAKSCTPVLPESLAAELSQRLGGRPIFWTVFAEPGASTNWLAEQVEKHRSSVAYNEYSMDKVVRLKNIFESPTDDDDDDSTTASSNGMENKEKWVRLLQRHKELHDITPFSEYDVVVIINGINDIKRAILPCMVTDDTDEKENDNGNNINSGSNRKQSGFQASVQRILDSLNCMPMRNHVHNISCSRCSSSSTQDSSSHECHQHYTSIDDNKIACSSSNIIMNSAFKLEEAKILDTANLPKYKHRGNSCHSLVKGEYDHRFHPLTRRRGQPVIVMPSLSIRFLPKKAIGTSVSHAICVYLADLMTQQKNTIAKQYHPADILIIKEPTVHNALVCNDMNILLSLIAVSSNECQELRRKMRSFYLAFPTYRYFSPDLIHPNDNCYRKIGHFFGKEIATHLHIIERK